MPTAAFLALAVLSGVTWYANADNYGRDLSVAELGRHVTAAVHELQGERDLSAGFMSNGRASSAADKVWIERLGRQHSTVDAALTGFTSAVTAASDDLGDGARAATETALASLTGLTELRESVRVNGVPAGAILGQYSTTIADLLDLDARIGQDGETDDLRDAAAVLVDLSAIKEISSQVRAQLFAVTVAGRFEFGQSDDLTSLLAQQSAAESRFRADASPDERTVYDQVVVGQAVLTVKRISDLAVDRQRLTTLDLDAEQWFAASTTYLELLRTVESELLDDVIAQAEAARSDAWQRTALIGVLIVGIVVTAVVLTLVIATSMTRSLRRLRSNALHVAHDRLPRIIEELRTADPDTVDTTVQPIGIHSRDEIGEVAGTFDELQLEAVRLAVEQAGLRRNVNTLFLSLSRRSQSLIERQISLIDRLEAAEENPAQLENLFKLDHLATRMRRNSENLLVLAGTGPGRRRTQPVPLGDVLRAANGEIEQYERVHITDTPETAVVAGAVIHLVHLVAELLENAAQFSPPHEPVDLAAIALEDGSVLITIDDNGLGMPPADLDEANRRLAEPPLFDFSIAQRLGLFVVARLADRHAISVRLTRSSSGGLRASVHLPLSVLDWDAPAAASVLVPDSVAGGRLAGSPAAGGASAGSPGQLRGFAPWPGAGGLGGGVDPFAPLSGNWFKQRGPADDPGTHTNGTRLGGAGRPAAGSNGAAVSPGSRQPVYRAPGIGDDSHDLPAIEDAVAALARRRQLASAQPPQAEPSRPELQVPELPEPKPGFNWFDHDAAATGESLVAAAAADESAPAGVASGTGPTGTGIGLRPPTADPVTDPALPVRVPHSSEFGGAWFDVGLAEAVSPDGFVAASPVAQSPGAPSPVAPAPVSPPPAGGPSSDPEAPGAPAPASAPRTEAEITVSDPDWIRGRLSRLYEGVNHARETRDGAPPPRRPDRRPNEG